ncbi:MAG: MipA/OmpV family protein [Betaproteobacteria bacterium]
MKKNVPTALLAVLALWPAFASAQAGVAGELADDSGADLPRWEAGFAGGGGRLPDYPGADQSHWRGIVAPVLFYRGPILNVDRSGVRGRVFDTPRLQFELTATAAFDAHSNEARAGMPDLDYLFGIGPQLVVKGLPGVPGAPALHLKLRAMYSTDFRRIDEHGATFIPELRWRARAPWPARATLALSLEPTWSSRGFARYFYEVTPAQATPTRPAYRARAGYLGTEVAANLTRRESRTLSWFVSGSALSLHGAANESSPLLRSRGNFTIGAGVIWTPWQSAARAGD